MYLTGGEAHRHFAEIIERQLTHFDEFHIRARRTSPQPIEQRLNRVRLADREHFDSTVVQVADVTGAAKLDRFLPGRGSIEHTLHATGNVATTRNEIGHTRFLSA